MVSCNLRLAFDPGLCISRQNIPPPPPPPAMGTPILNICMAFRGVDYTDLQLVIGCMYVAEAFNFTLRTRPSLPGNTWRTLPAFHFPRTVLISIGHTCNDENVDGYVSFVHIPLPSGHKLREDISSLFLPERVHALLAELINRWRGFSVWWNEPCGTVLVALPNRISLGQKYAPSPGSFKLDLSVNLS